LFSKPVHQTFAAHFVFDEGKDGRAPRTLAHAAHALATYKSDDFGDSSISIDIALHGDKGFADMVVKLVDGLTKSYKVRFDQRGNHAKEHEAAQRVDPGGRRGFQDREGFSFRIPVQTAPPRRQNQDNPPRFRESDAHGHRGNGSRRALARIDDEATVDEAMNADGRPHSAADTPAERFDGEFDATRKDG
jgi:hypothetical protein